MKKNNKKRQNKSSEVEYKEGDLVGAKVKGYPLWPGRVEKTEYVNNKRRYTVRFFGTDDTSQTFMQIKHFRDFTNHEKACSSKGFKEALELCQKEYDLSKRCQEEDKHEDEEKREENSSPSSSPNDYNSMRLVISNDKEDLVDGKTTKQGLTKSPNADISCMETEDDKISHANSIDFTKKETIQTNKSPKSEGENVAFDSTLAKLREKVAKKLEEKKARKIERKELKMSTKVSEKLGVINNSLKKFSRIVKKLSNARSINQSHIDEWNAAVRTYESAFPILHKCIKYYFKNSATKRKISEQPIYRECQKILIEIISDVKEAMKNAQAHGEFKKNLKNFLKKMKCNSEVKEFLNQTEPETFKNAMIERRENDAE